MTKPGIIYGNLLTATAGFLLASKGHINGWQLLSALTGTALIIACGCVINNYIDRGIDRQMARTKTRAIAQGLVSAQSAFIYATALGVFGFLVLARYTNWLTVLAGLTGLFFYVVLYSIFKRRSVHGTLVGAVSGAMPPVAGYLAVTNHFDSAALLLFIMLVCWQMPHFYAIAMYRYSDYKAAGLPVLPVKRGFRATKVQILLYIAAFTLATAMLTALGYTGYIFLVVMLAAGLSWLWYGVQGFKVKNDTSWARKMFFYSLVVTLVLSVMLSVGSVLA